MCERDDLRKPIRDPAGLPGRVIRGPRRWIDRLGVPGIRVLAVEDTSTTGVNLPADPDGLREAGADVSGVAVIVDGGAGDAVRPAGPDERSAYSLTDLGLVV